MMKAKHEKSLHTFNSMCQLHCAFAAPNDPAIGFLLLTASSRNAIRWKSHRALPQFGKRLEFGTCAMQLETIYATQLSSDALTHYTSVQDISSISCESRPPKQYRECIRLPYAMIQ